MKDGKICSVDKNSIKRIEQMDEMKKLGYFTATIYKKNETNYGRDEFDPFGYRISTIHDTQHETCNLQEAICNMPDNIASEYKLLCVRHDSYANSGNTAITKEHHAAIKAHEYLMKWVALYWQGVRDKLEAEQ